MRNLALAFLIMFSLAACAPPAVTIASFVADGVSYLATGKSTTDHAISAVVREDCALLRLVENEPVCDPDGEVLIELIGTEIAEDEGFEPGDFQ